MKSDFPKISIVTPSFNQGRFIEKTILSVIEQDYPNLEYIIIDGGSTDESVEIIKKYEKHLAYWVSEPDRGQSHAINKGFERATGEICGWLNSDDYYNAAIFESIVDFFITNPDKNIVMGDCNLVREDGELFDCVINDERGFDELRRYWVEKSIPTQPAIFFRGKLLEEYGYLDESLNYAMDYDLWLRFGPKNRFYHLPIVIANYRFHSEAKGGDYDLAKFEPEWKAVFSRYLTNDISCQVLELERQLAERDKEHYKIMQRLAECERNLNLKTSEAAEKDRNIKEIYSSVSWKITAPLRKIPVGAYEPLLKSYVSAKKRFFSKRVTNTLWPEGLPLVSVVIPCFNYGKYVEEAIDSVLGQTFTNFEIIVIDGGSTDTHTITKLKSLKKEKTTILYREGRHLVGDNRNFGIEKARGKYICCLDADDMLKPTYLEKALFMAETLNFDIVYPSAQFFGNGNKVWTVNDVTFLTCAEGDNISTVALFKKEAWSAVKGYKDWGLGDEYVYEDWEFWVRMLGNGYRAKRLIEPLMLYRIHGSGLTANTRKSIEEQKDIIRKENEKLFTVSNIVKVNKINRINYQVEEPFINLEQESCKNVLFALPFMIVGGQDTVLLQLAHCLIENGYRISCITTLPVDGNLGRETSDKYEEITKEIYHLYKFLENHEEWKEFIFYLIEAKKIGIIYLVGCEYLYHLLPEIKMKYPNLKVVDQLYNTVGHVANNRNYSRYIDMNIVENEEVLDFLIADHHENENKVQQIHNGVDLQIFSRQATVIASEIYDKYAIPRNKFIVSFIGRFSEEKGPDRFVEIACGLRNKDNLYFVMGGSGVMLAQTADLVTSHKLTKKVLLAGVIDTREILQISDVVIVPSRIDGRPNIILESFAMGVPVIASRVGGIPMIISDGYNGFLCDDTQHFIEKIRLLAEDNVLKEQMGNNALIYAIDHLDITKTMNEYLSVFVKLIDS